MALGNNIVQISNGSDILNDCLRYAKENTTTICENCIRSSARVQDYSVQSILKYKQLEKQQRAKNLLYQIENGKLVVRPETPETDSWWMKKDWILYGTQQYEGLSAEERAFYRDKEETPRRHKVFINDDERNTNIQIFNTLTEVDEFTGLKKHDGTYDGITIDKIEVPKEYADFIKSYTQNNKASLARFVKIMKAFSTTTAFSKEQQQGSAKDIKYEDVDFFDVSGDGKLNLDDKKEMELRVCAQKNEKFKYLMKKFKDDPTKVNNFNVVYFSDNSGETQFKIHDMLNFDDEDQITPNDFELLQKTNFMINFDNYSDTYDINKDGTVDEDDKKLLEKYFEALSKIVASNEQANDAILDVFGGQEKLQRTMNLLGIDNNSKNR